MKREETLEVTRKRQEQMLKLVARSFYKELINYGVNSAEVLSVAAHLLDNVLQLGGRNIPEKESHNQLFVIGDVKDMWSTVKRLELGEVSVAPLRPEHIPQIASWLKIPVIQENFHPPFPDDEVALANYLKVTERAYFSICYRDALVGIVGAENIDTKCSKLEMRKLIGDPGMHGKGIGKRATFLFLYYVFLIRKFVKVYVHSMDTNIRNLNLNGKFGFELEGVFLQDVLIQQRRRDVVRMALVRPVWLELFSGTRVAGDLTKVEP